MLLVCLHANKLENLMFSENVMIGQSSSMCPGLSVRTVRFLPLMIQYAIAFLK